MIDCLLESGLALMAEAFMSAAYHICPSNANYQFGKQRNMQRVHVWHTSFISPYRYDLHVCFGWVGIV